MNIRKVAYLLLTFSIVMIVSGSVSCFVSELEKDKEETFRRIYTVNDEFELFSTNTSIFEEFRNQLYDNYLNTIYIETMYQNDIELKNKLLQYEKIVDELQKNTEKMDNLCKNVYYPDGEANNKCINYQGIYEQVVNYFVTDIHLYNNYVQKYNTSLENDLVIDEYETKKEYIDYNHDKKYEGKEE